MMGTASRCPTTGQVLALDLGGTKTTAAIVRVGEHSADVLRRATIATPAASGGRQVLASALQVAEDVLGRDRVDAVGIASAGVIDPATGRVTHATSALPGWVGTRLAEAAGHRFDVPAAALNDVHAHGLGEALWGAGLGCHSMLLAAVGTGIGGCLVLEGRPHFGAGAVAGHLGHLPCPEADGVVCSCGRTGHLEGFASGPGIHAAFLRAGGQATDTREVARLASSGDALASETIDRAGFATGRILGGLLNCLDPDVVVLTGGVVDIGEPWWAAMRRGVAHDAMDAVATTPVRPASAGVEAALLGAAAWALTTTRKDQP